MTIGKPVAMVDSIAPRGGDDRLRAQFRAARNAVRGDGGDDLKPAASAAKRTLYWEYSVPE